MHIIYIDDSGDQNSHIFSALAIPATTWHRAFEQVRAFRRNLAKSDGIFVYREFHAWEFVSGRGRIADQIVTKSRRCQIFKEALQLVASLPGAALFNTHFPVAEDELAFERLLNRINRTMQAWDSQAILVCDQGKEANYIRLCRRMAVYNPIPSQFGVWNDTGQTNKNVPIDRIIEDPFFKDSRRSYMIQLADFCAYALLRREHPLPSKTKYGLEQAFDLLSPVLVRAANRKDPDGIIRP